MKRRFIITAILLLMFAVSLANFGITTSKKAKHHGKRPTATLPSDFIYPAIVIIESPTPGYPVPTEVGYPVPGYPSYP